MATIRYLAAPNLALELHVYDESDMPVETIVMVEVMSGVYRASTTSDAVDSWAIIKDASGNSLDIIRVSPNIVNLWSHRFALNIQRYLGLK